MEPLTLKDQRALKDLEDYASLHDSGGTYAMVASYVRGSRRILGSNRLSHPARTRSRLYPDICGMHAELDVVNKCEKAGFALRGGSIYVTGRKISSGNLIITTRPCEYCTALLKQTQVKFVVFMEEGIVRKERIDSWP